jgi:hypothetical protein
MTMDGMMTDMMAEEPEPQIQLTLPRSTFDLAKGFLAGMSQAIGAAEAQLKAEEKAMKASATMDEVLATGTDLAGFGDELSAMSDSRLGIPPMA